MELTTIRLPEELARAVDQIAEQRQVTRSEIVRDALEQYCRKTERRSPKRLELLSALVTYPGSGVGDLARRSQAYLRKRFREKRRTR
jgi:metal-responsive CopG/Arc/MetJ family transcriptional regulator